MLKKEGVSTTKCNYQQTYMIYKSLRRQIRIYSYFLLFVFFKGLIE